MWIKFKINKSDVCKVNLSSVKMIQFCENVIYLCFGVDIDEYVTIKREYNKDFDEIVEKLINL